MWGPHASPLSLIRERIPMRAADKYQFVKALTRDSYGISPGGLRTSVVSFQFFS